MSKQSLIEKIRKLDKDLKELDAQITANEKKIKRCGATKNTKDVEELQQQIEGLKGKKDEFQKERSYLQKVVQLQGTLEIKQRRIKELNNQIKELDQNNEQIEELNKEIVDLRQKINELKSEIQELKKKIEERDHCIILLETKVKENELNHKNRMNEITAKHEKEIADLRRKTREQQEIHSRKMDELHESNNFLEHEVQNLKAKHSKKENDLCNYKKYMRYCSEENQHTLYLGQICSDLQTNWYRYVMPERCHAKHRAYKVKNIIEDIEDDELLSEEERTEAQRKWEELQSKIEWKKNERLIKAIKRLQCERNKKAHPKDLSEEGARSAAEKLRDQGKLQLKPSFQNIQKVISLWVSSKSL